MQDISMKCNNFTSFMTNISLRSIKTVINSLFKKKVNALMVDLGFIEREHQNHSFAKKKNKNQKL